MPTDPLRMPPKRSLGIFKGLGDVLDKRKQRQIADEDRQQKLEDRVFGSIRQGQQDMAAEEMRTLEKALGEERLSQMRRPTLINAVGADGSIQRTPDAPGVRVQMPETKRRTQLVKDHRGVMVAADLDTGMDLEGKPIRAWQDPKDPGGAEKAPTDGERKGAAFMHRVIPAGQRLNQFDNRKFLDALLERAGIWGNWAKSDEGRQLEQAGRTWVTSVLRPESGATITPDEMEGYQRTYLPMPHDDEATLAMKRQARREAEESISTIAGRALPKGTFTSAMQADSAAAANKPRPTPTPTPTGLIPKLTPVSPKPQSGRNPWRP